MLLAAARRPRLRSPELNASPFPLTFGSGGFFLPVPAFFAQNPKPLFGKPFCAPIQRMMNTGQRRCALPVFPFLQTGKQARVLPLFVPSIFFLPPGRALPPGTGGIFYALQQRQLRSVCPPPHPEKGRGQIRLAGGRRPCQPFGGGLPHPGRRHPRRAHPHFRGIAPATAFWTPSWGS